MGTYVLLAFFGWVLWMVVRSRMAEDAKPVPKVVFDEAVVEVAHTWPELGEFDFEVVGESNYQRALSALAGDHGDQAANAVHQAVLVPDDSNPHDDKAVRVEIGGQLVGYLDRDDARSFRRRLGRNKLTGKATACAALIMGGFIDRDGGRASYGVRLDIKPFE